MPSEIVLNARVLATVIKTLKPFQSTEETRYYLCGISFELGVDDDTMKCVATDGHKMCVLDVEAMHDEFENPIKAIIPAKALVTIASMIKGLDPEYPVKLAFHDDHVEIDAGDEKGDFKLVDGTYPDWRKVMPTNTPEFVIGLGKAQAKAALEAVRGHIGKDGMEWQLTDAASPLLMKGEKKTVVVMPMRVSLPGEQTTDNAGQEEDGDDELFDKAKELVLLHRKCSTSWLQRELKLGYNRAARLVERLEGEGIVSMANHVGKREVLDGTTSAESED